MFSTDDFQAWGKDNAILFAAVMTKIEGRKDDALLRTYEFRGFPSMAVLDASANAVTKSIPRDLQSMQRIVAATPGYVKLAAAVDAGEDVNASEWFLARLRLGKLTSAEAKEQLAEGVINATASLDLGLDLVPLASSNTTSLRKTLLELAKTQLSLSHLILGLLGSALSFADDCVLSAAAAPLALAGSGGLASLGSARAMADSRPHATDVVSPVTAYTDEGRSDESSAQSGRSMPTKTPSPPPSSDERRAPAPCGVRAPRGDVRGRLGRSTPTFMSRRW